MNGWLIYRKEDAIENSTYIEWFIKEATKQDVRLELVYREELRIGIQEKVPILSVAGIVTEKPDLVIIRVMEPFLQRQFETMQIPTFNNHRVTSICNHKAYTYLEMNQLGIPIQPTYFVAKDAMPDILPLPFPFVVKTATGHGGKHVFYIHDRLTLQRALQQIDTNDLIIQSTEKIQLGKDVRVFVIGREVIAAVLRENNLDFRANFKLGGTARLFPLTEEMRAMVQTIIDYFDFGLVGIDFLLNEAGEFVFNEIEDVVGSRILSETTTINLLEKYVTWIKQEVKK
jgi:RimK family alpha-L-glutamate ligase